MMYSLNQGLTTLGVGRESIVCNLIVDIKKPTRALNNLLSLRPVKSISIGDEYLHCLPAAET